jgi:sulfatase maturation enzyme AslB (radical SAM superfamily)
MDMQSLSICVPAGCPNKCKFCCAAMQRGKYSDQIEKNRRFRDLYKKDFKRRLQFCRDNGCNVVVLTGDGEPLMNIPFLDNFAEWNEGIERPFRWVELQTSGVTLDDEKLRYLRNTVGVSTISLSLSDMFDSGRNQDYNGTPANLKVDIDKVCSEVKRYDFNLRLSLNMTDAYNDKTPEALFARLKALGANQVTFRVLYVSGTACEQDVWINQHRVNPTVIEAINGYINRVGRELEVLSFGATRWSVEGISTVLDGDCMSGTPKQTLRYAILRPDCKLYSKWDDEGSLIF